jgi:predicted glutamine amidotransferase
VVDPIATNTVWTNGLLHCSHLALGMTPTLGPNYTISMCRLFGFRSSIESQVHKSLLQAENSLVVQSEEHSDGWGIAHYTANAPHLLRSVNSAVDDRLFKKVSGIVSSQTVIAHLRRATAGKKSILNTHPFQFGHWVFAHNGTIKDYPKNRSVLLDNVDQDLKRYVLGDTDSELMFFLILSELKKQKNLPGTCSTQSLVKACRGMLKVLSDTVGDFNPEDTNCVDNNYYTFLITCGDTLLAHHGGKQLFYSTYKSRCSERDTCEFFSSECEAATQTGKVHHLIFASEVLGGENIWHPLEPGEIMAIGKDMKLVIDQPKASPCKQVS